MIVLPDSSIWIEYLQGQETRIAGRLRSLIRRRSTVVCGPVVAEVLAGAGDEHRDELWQSMASLPWAPLPHDAWFDVGAIGAALRSRRQRVPQTDAVIAVAAASARAAVWSVDRDFRRIKAVYPQLELYEPG